MNLWATRSHGAFLGMINGTERQIPPLAKRMVLALHELASWYSGHHDLHGGCTPIGVRGDEWRVEWQREKGTRE